MTKSVQTLVAVGLTMAGWTGSAWAQTPTPAATPAATAVATAEPAATPAAKPEVTTGATKLKVGGALWPVYSYDLTEGNKNRNSFDVGRAYVNVEPSWGDQFYARITPDLVRETGPAVVGTGGTLTPGNTVGNLSLRLKYAYLGYKIHPMVDLRVGMQPTAFVEFEEGIWGNRFVAQIAGDAFYGISSSDFGYSVATKLLDGKLEVVTGGFNGETYTKAEANKYKELQTRVTYQIMPAGKDPGLKVTGYYSYGLAAQDVDKVRAIALVTYQAPFFTAGAEYIYAQNGGGATGPRTTGGGPSVFGFVNLPWEGARVIARVDSVDPNSEADDDGTTRVIFGVGMRPMDKLAFMLDYQLLDFEDSGRENASVLFAHWEAKF